VLTSKTANGLFSGSGRDEELQDKLVRFPGFLLSQVNWPLAVNVANK